MIEIIHILLNIDERYQEKSLSTLQSGDIVYCIDIFLIFSGNTHFAQKLLENYLDKMQEFLSYNIKYRNNNSYELYAMAIMNDIPMYLHMPASTTVQNN